ncbi:MAG TPA: hypothetical protein DCF33_10140 [Saprospirales bacterium]|nr:hypothetical protein [Saprospirales bacterium]
MTSVPKAAVQDTYVFAAQPITPQKQTKEIFSKSKAIHSEVVFGSPTMNCNGTGICRISSLHSVRPEANISSCQKTVAQIVPGDYGNITLFFHRSMLCINLFRKHFYKGMLEMHEPCVIPADLLERLNIQTRVILPGKYAITEHDGMFRLVLDCQ